MAKFLCITLNPAIDLTLELDTLKVGQVNRVQHSQQHPAGKGLNVAQVLRELGHEIWVTGFLGHDNRAMFETDFAQKGFHNHFIYVTGQTRQNIKIAETRQTMHGQMTDINGKGFSVTASHIRELLQTCGDLAREMDYVVLAGSLPQAFELTDFEKLIHTIQNEASTIAPKLAIDTSGEALKVAFSQQPFLLKPNDNELTECFALPAKTYAQQLALLQKQPQRPQHLVISLGSEGVNWLMPNTADSHALHAKPPVVTVKSTVGAGDTLLAGILHGLATGLSTSDTLTLATALASHTVSQVGCELPDKERLEVLKSHVVIHQLTV